MIKLFIFITFITFLFPVTSFADSRLDRCLPYKDEIISLLESENVPSDYFYLAVCESGCRNAVSNKGAHGFFQLMPYTYYKYMSEGCTKKDIDDIRCNTVAAARYIKHLQKRFKDIATLVKAYNRGGTNYQRYGTTKEADSLSWCVIHYIGSN